MLQCGILFHTLLPTFTKYLLKQFAILSGPVISSPFESRIEMSVLFDGFMVTNDLIPFHSAAVFFLFFFEILFIIF